MLTTTRNNSFDLDISIEEALALQEKLAKAIAHTPKYNVSSLTMPTSVENDSNAKKYPGLVNLSVWKDLK